MKKTRQCGVPGCTGHTTRWGRYCSSHAAHARRHGHPLQRTLTKTELRPYEAAVTARITRNADNPLWPGLEANWKAVCGQAEAILAEYRKGIPVARTARLAAQEAARLAQHLEPRSIVVTALAVYLLQEAGGRRFKSDEAFRFQLVRRVRGLTEANAGLWFEPRRVSRRPLGLSQAAKVCTSVWA